MLRRRPDSVPLISIVAQLGTTTSKTDGVPENTSVRAYGTLDRTITCLCSLEEPNPGGLAFLARPSLNALKRVLADPQVQALGAILIKDTILGTESYGTDGGPTLIAVADPFRTFLGLLDLFFEPIPVASGVHPTAVIDTTADIAEGVAIGPYCVIGANALIEAGAVLHPHVVVYEGAIIRSHAVLHSGVTIREFCEIGPNTTIQNGAVIGGDGFGYVPDPKLGLRPVPQVGIVSLVGNNDIGANTCIDRATLGTTKIGFGTKVDNLAQIGHNNHIGTHSIICGAAAIAGSCRIGDQVVIGGQVGIADHVTIANGVRVAGGSGVTHSLKEKGDYSGYPVAPANEWKRVMLSLSHVPDLVREWRVKRRGGE